MANFLEGKVWQFLHNRSLSIFLFSAFLISLVLHLIFSLLSHAHEEVWAYEFLRDVFENWQSEFLQCWTLIWATKIWRHRGSPQSKDWDSLPEEEKRA